MTGTITLTMPEEKDIVISFNVEIHEDPKSLCEQLEKETRELRWKMLCDDIFRKIIKGESL